MINWKEIIAADSESELKNAKLWLFQENMRLENERKELEQAREKFINERTQFRTEMNSLNHKTFLERKRLREENIFFDKKLEILKEGFAQLDADRRALNREKKAFIAEKNARLKEKSFREKSITGDVADILFRGINNPLALRKRYRDLVKIYHPDNIFGDEEMIQIINREYLRRKKEE